MDWDIVRRVALDRERARLGLPSRMDEEAARAKREQEAALAASQLETAGVSRELSRAQIAALPEQADLRRRLTEAQIANYAEQPQPRAEPSSLEERILAMPPEQQAAALKLYREMHPRPVAGAGMAIGPTVAMSDAQGNPIIVDKRTGKPVGAPPPTAEMRNTEYQSGAVEPAFELVKQSLEGFKQASAGGLPGAPSALIPGTDAYYAMGRFRDQAKALLGAIVARQAGEGSRLSDEDRVAYSQAASLVNGALMLPGGPEEAGLRIEQAQNLINSVMARRKQIGAGQGMPAASAQPGGVRVQRNKRTGEVRHSLDGGATWQPGPPPQ